MYHIKFDRRAVNSANKVTRVLIEAMDREDIFNLSVSTIAERAGISRSTFYRNFDNVSDVVDYILDNAFQDFKVTTVDGIPTDIIKDMVLFCTDYDIIFYSLLTNKRGAIIVDHFNKWFRENEIAFKNPKEGKEVLRYYFTTLIFSVLGNVLLWYQQGKKETPEQLIDQIYDYSRVIITLKNRYHH